MRRPGARAVPSLKYLHTVPRFSEHHYAPEEEGGDGSDQGPTGGLMWDGRASSRQAQSRLPLLNPNEMANPDIASVVAKVQAAPYADTLRRLYGERVFDDPQKAFSAIAQAIDYYEQTPAEFFPFNSKYDAYLMGKAALSKQELRGLKVFLNPQGGNCVSCHKLAAPGVLPLFNDFGLIALGVPRNPAIPANADPGYHDMGLCGPIRTDLQDHPEYCGLFRSPTLRNVARRKVFFHNGYFHRLRDVVEFYAKRDTQPEKFYPRRPDGDIARFNDLPDPRYWRNVNTDPPFGGRPGGKPAMSEQDIDDLVAFLQSLNDGYKPLPRQASR
jgi:cytochrome c peroxidase